MFTVKEIISGGEIMVFPNWRWEGKTGNKVIINGFHPPTNESEYGFRFAKNKLTTLLKEKEIELFNPFFIDKYISKDVLFCNVYLDEINIKNYFPEFR